MTDRGRRLGKGIAIALAVHIIAAALLGILGYRFTQRPPQILEVTLGGGGGGGTAYYTLTFETNGGGSMQAIRAARGKTLDLAAYTPMRDGYDFGGWYADKELTQAITEIKMTSNKTVYAGWEETDVPGMLNGEDHYAYVVGYEDGRIVLNPLYVFEEDENSTLTKVSGRLKRTEYAMKNDHKLRLAGFQETI